MKLRIIYNPRSGRHRRTARLRPLLRDFVARHCPDADLVATEGPGHATELAREAAAAGCQRVLAVGGDGTMNEVAQALLHTPTALGLIPCGSGNGLARHLRLPVSALSALILATDRETGVAALDTGVINGRPFCNAMGFGLDADVSQRFNRLARRGLPAYVRTVFAAFGARRAEFCRIDAGGRTETLESLLISAANSDQYGNGALIAPGARADDGFLDLIAVRPVGYAGAVCLAVRLFSGTIDRSPRVRRWRGTRFEITRPAAGCIHTDGEPHSADACLRVEIAPASLRVVVPAAFHAARPLAEGRSPGVVLQLP